MFAGQSLSPRNEGPPAEAPRLRHYVIRATEARAGREIGRHTALVTP